MGGSFCLEVFIIILYKPERQFMEPNEMVLDPTIENKFSVLVNGTKCIGYRFSVYDAADALVEKASTEKTLLETPLYNDDLLEIPVATDVFTAGNEYKWQIALYANDVIATGTHILRIHGLNFPSFPVGLLSQIRPIVTSVNASTKRAIIIIPPTIAAGTPITSV